MTDLCALCFEVVRLLAEKIEPEIEFDVNFDSCTTADNVNEQGMLCILKFLEMLKDSGCQIKLDGDELYYKLVELANTILMADFGEVSAFQNYVYERVTVISELLKPGINTESVPANGILQLAVPGTSKQWSYVDRNDDYIPVNPRDEEIAYDQDPIYAEIAELVESVAEKRSKKINISAKINSIIRYFSLRSPHRCKNSFMNRIADIKEAVNFLSRSKNNVSYTNFLKFQADEIYMMLRKDIFYDDDHSMLTEMKIAWAILWDKIGDYFADSRLQDTHHEFKPFRNFWNQLFVTCMKFKCNRTNGIILVILNFLILGFCIIV